MRTLAGLIGLLIAVSLVSAADTPSTVTIKPDGTGTVKLGQSVYFSYPHDKAQTPKFKRLIIEKKNVLGLKEVHTGAADRGENHVAFTPSKVGTFPVVIEIFVGPLENAQVAKYSYTLVVKKRDDE